METLAPVEKRARAARCALEARCAATELRFAVLARSFGEPATCVSDNFFGDLLGFRTALAAACAQNERARRVRVAADRRRAARAARSSLRRKSDTSRKDVTTAVAALKHDTADILARLQGPRSHARASAVAERTEKFTPRDALALPRTKRVSDFIRRVSSAQPRSAVHNAPGTPATSNKVNLLDTSKQWCPPTAVANLHDQSELLQLVVGDLLPPKKDGSGEVFARLVARQKRHHSGP